jgi:DNA modification methylase
MAQLDQRRWPPVIKALDVEGLVFERGSIFYYKSLSEIAAQDNRWQVGHRPFVIYRRAQLPEGKHDWATVDAYGVGYEPATWHPYEQPLAPYVYWLDKLTAPGDVILDPFCGSGTTGVACLRVGLRTFVGCEIDPERAHTARVRIAKEAARLKQQAPKDERQRRQLTTACLPGLRAVAG